MTSQKKDLNLNCNFILLTYIQLKLFAPTASSRTNRLGGKTLYQKEIKKVLFSLQRYFVSYTFSQHLIKLKFHGNNFLNQCNFFPVLDDKFDVPGKVVSYPVAEVSQNYFRQEELRKSINLIKE